MGVKRKSIHISECSQAWFRYGFMQYTGERPKITDRRPGGFKINGIPVEIRLFNRKSQKITCPNCGRYMLMMLKYPMPGSVWGCRACMPHDRIHKTHLLERRLRDYTMDEIMKMPTAKLEKITGQDAIQVIAKITESPERYLKTDHAFRPVDKLQWRTDDDRIPCAVKMAKKACSKDRYSKRSKGKIIKIRMHRKVWDALKQFAFENAMPTDRAAGACVRWCMEHSDKIQVRPI